MARMWEYRDEHELAEGKRKRQEEHARYTMEMKERRRRKNASARERILAMRKAEPMEQVTMTEQSQQFVTVEQYNAMIQKFKRFVAHVNQNFNELAKEVEQLKETVNALKPGKQTKKSGFQGRSAELEAELDDLSPSKTPEIDTTEVASKLAKVLAKGNGQ
jgi:hypothetical protein